MRAIELAVRLAIVLRVLLGIMQVRFTSKKVGSKQINKTKQRDFTRRRPRSPVDKTKTYITKQRGSTRRRPPSPVDQ